MFATAARRVAASGAAAMSAAALADHSARAAPSHCARLRKGTFCLLPEHKLDKPDAFTRLLLITEVEAKHGLQYLDSWLGLSPQLESKCQDALHTNFPQALAGSVIMLQTSQALAPYGFSPENTVYGQSICPDDMNNQKRMLADRMQQYWGECFRLGCIGDPPFVGKAGHTALSHRNPDGERILILFGPHIGISDRGEVGKFYRPGQKHRCSTAACGALVAAPGPCCERKCKWERQESIEEATPEPMAALVIPHYEIAQKKLQAIIDTDIGDGYVVLLGGVQIDMPEGVEDHFVPLMFEMRRAGEPAIDLMHVFGCDTTGKGSMLQAAIP